MGAGRLAAALLVGAVVSAAPQQLPVAEASASGRVIDAVTGRAVSGATVRVGPLRSLRTPGPPATTTASGEFRVRSSAGSVELWASKDGYQDGGFGQRSAGGSSARLTLEPGQELKDLTLKLWPHGVISGRILDDVGEGVAGAEVVALEESVDFERVGWRVVSRGRAISDDRGQFRLRGIKPGAYLIAVPSADTSYSTSDVKAAEGEFLTSYFPGVTSVDSAAQVAVTAGQSVELGDFRLLPPAGNAVRIQGRLRGELRGEWHVELAPLFTTAWSEIDIYRTNVVSDGTFSFPAVAPGPYRVRAMGLQGWTNTLTADGGKLRIPVPPTYNRQATAPESHVYWAEREVVAGPASVLPVTLEISPEIHIRGKLVFDGDGAPPSTTRLLSTPVLVIPTDGRVFRTMPTTNLDSSGSFATPAHPPGGYLVTVHPIDGWRAEFVTVGGARLVGGRIALEQSDVVGVEVHLTNRVATLEGVVNGDPQKRTSSTVIVFPVDRLLWTNYAIEDGRVQATLADVDGRYRFASMLPGDYLVAVVAGDPPRKWRSAGFLTPRSTTAARVALRAGAAAVVNLSLVR